MRCVVGVAFAFVLCLGSGRADTPADSSDPDAQTLRDAHLGTDDVALLDVFRKRLLPPADRKNAEELIRKLDDDSYEVREQASEDLIDFGPAVAPLLRQALKSPSLEVVRRAKYCLKHVAPPPVEVLSAAARLIGARKPAGSLETLLTYLPVAEDDELVGEIRASITALAYQAGKPRPELLKALTDHRPVLRIAAADALYQAGGRQALPLLQPLLQDSDPDVRFDVAQHLADLRVADAFPVLIDLTATKGPTAGLADSYLRELADSEAPKATPGTTDASRAACRKAWQTWWQHIDGLALLRRIRQGTPDEAARRKAAALIQQLGDDNFVRRERASEELIQMGAVAVPLLQKVTESRADDADFEVVHRAELCLTRLGDNPKVAITPTVLRLVATLKPAGAASALLSYLPFANGDEGQEEVRKALSAVAYVGGQPDQAVLRALHDPMTLRRSAAAVALIDGSAQPPAAIQELLHDRDPLVQLQVAVALVEHKDRTAVPALIDLLAHLPADQLWRAEELLRQLAGTHAPRTALGKDAASQTRCRDAWLAWWRKDGSRVDMAALDGTARMLGYTLIVQFSQWGNNTGRVYEIGPDKKIRWKVDGLNLPVDAQMVGSNHFLVAEYYSSQVTERDLKGKVVWQHPANNPVSVQRLANGHTFFAGQNEIMEVDRGGKTIFSFNPPGGCMAARRLRNGQVVAVSNGGMLSRMDTTGKVLKSWSVGNTNLGGMDVTANGHILVSQNNTSKVMEYDLDGKTVWQHAVNWPTSAVRLPNGNTLISSQNMQQIVEVNRAGKTVWDYKPDGRPWHARRR